MKIFDRQDQWDIGFEAGQKHAREAVKQQESINKEAANVKAATPRLGIFELSKRWGMADLNDVKMLADKECVRIDTRIDALMSSWWGGRVIIGHPVGEYDQDAVVEYEERVQRRLINKAVVADLAAQKRAVKKVAK